MALANMGFNDKFGLILEDQNRRERERGEQKERRRGRGRRWRSQDQANKVWKLTLIMNSMRFDMDIWFCMIIILPKPRVLLGFHLNPKIMEIKVG